MPSTAEISTPDLLNRLNAGLKTRIALGQYDMPITGSAQGYNTQGDIVSVTGDGVDLNKLWTDYAAVLDQFNSSRSAVQNLVTFGTTVPGDAVPQTITRNDFELASEYGEPKGIRVPGDVLKLGYTFDDYDLASRYTWRYLRDATQSQIDAVHDLAMEADNRLIFNQVMGALFTKTNRTNNEGLTVYSLWNGTDGSVPPPYQANVFDSTHNHYFTTGATSVDSGDLEALYAHVTHHGYGQDSGSQLIAFVNPAQGATIRSFRAGVANANGAVASWDYIPAEGTPTFLSTQQIIGDLPKASFGQQPIIGAYGPLLIAESGYIPVGYLAVVASGGPNSTLNPVGIREHPNAAYQGLRLLPGNRAGYPLIDSFYARSFGTGIRQRGAAAVSQITASATYTSPTFI